MVALVLAGCSDGTASGGSSKAPAGSVKEIVAAAQKEGSLNLEGLGLVFGGDGLRHPNPKAERCRPLGTVRAPWYRGYGIKTETSLHGVESGQRVPFRYPEPLGVTEFCGSARSRTTTSRGLRFSAYQSIHSLPDK